MPIGHFTSTDDFFHGTRAAAFGGTTAIVDFVETRPDETMLNALAARRAVAADAVIDYGLHMTIGPTDIAKLDQLAEARAAGCGSVKLYMAYGLRLTDGDLLLALEKAAEVDAQPVVHAENWDVITTLIARNLAAGRTTPRWHPRSRPAELEWQGRARHRHRYLRRRAVHIFHVSCAATVRTHRRRQGAWSAVTGETCPQYST
jgi:dihydropyrimidinase